MTPYLTHKDQLVLLVPMEIQPVGELDFAGTYDHKFGREIYYEDSLGRTFESPIRVGDRVPVREEWRFQWASNGDDCEPTFWIELRDGTIIDITSHFEDITDFTDTAPAGWQPASTMPDFAVRYWRRATKVEEIHTSKLEPETPLYGCDHIRWVHSICDQINHDIVNEGHIYIWRIEVDPEEGE